MNCDGIHDENIIERYVTGELEPELKEAFEEHCFDCGNCVQLLELWQMIAEPLHETAPQVRVEMKRRSWRIWAGAGVAAAMALALSIGIAPGPSTASRSAIPVPVARLAPPAYAEPVMRGMETRAEALFRAAMRHYEQRDWPAAVEGLRASLALDPQAAAPRFFLGASLVLSGNSAQGIRELEPVASGGSPFAEEARFVRAHGYLQLDRDEDARNALEELAAGHGDFAARAARLLNELSRGTR